MKVSVYLFYNNTTLSCVVNNFVHTSRVIPGRGLLCHQYLPSIVYFCRDFAWLWL